MERIKEAIERAKAAQGAADSSVSPKTDAVVAGAPSTRESDTSTDEDSAEVDAKISYRQTSVIELDPIHLEENRIISFTKTDSRTLTFDRLRTQVMRRMQDNGWRTLAITSPAAGCGKTTVAINLAMSIAHQTEQTVLLADLDLRTPRLAQYLGLPKAASLVDYINGESKLMDVFVNPSIPRLTFLPNHHAIVNSAEMIMTARMKALVADIRDRYESRLVIFDLPALLTTDDALAFLPQVDCILAVVENGVSTKSQVRDSFRLLQNTPIVGVVLNKGERVAPNIK